MAPLVADCANGELAVSLGMFSIAFMVLLLSPGLMTDPASAKTGEKRVTASSRSRLLGTHQLAFGKAKAKAVPLQVTDRPGMVAWRAV